MRIERHLEESARRFPDKTALVAGGVRTSYAALEDEAARLAASLVAGGVSRGDRVVVFADNCREAVVALYAAAKAGACFSVINASTKSDKLALILADCEPTALVTQRKLAATARAALEGAPSVACVIVADGGAAEIPGALAYEAASAAERAPLPSPGIVLDLAMLVYTSGSTGRPKGVMMTHQTVHAAASSITTYLENTPDDVILCALPISFDYGLYQVLMSVMVGATLVLEKGFAFPQAVLNRVREEKVTGFPLVPTMAALLLAMRDLEPGSLPGLRYVSNTAAALPPAHIERLQALLPTTRIYSMYGLTECKRCTWLPPEELTRRPGSVGVAIPGTEAFVVDDAGRPVAPGEVGELVIRGPHVMKGYWRNEEATNAALRPGPFPWEKVLYTGDLFRTDADGFLYFVARKDDIIKTRGEKVAPKEVESVLYMLDGVREATVIGVPHPVLGQALKALVALEPGVALDARAVVRHCARHLEDFMVPSEVTFVAELPKTTTGKISRREAATLIAAE
ncbi:AMP-binding protein [Salinarimonas sp.]|uniref:class I adenylate-forming enzyme family protein n=1 Tax=Salinarimonas sp. TaxID=2766526 RepID=UPI0032D9A2A1